jgi:hypothetical protein
MTQHAEKIQLDHDARATVAILSVRQCNANQNKCSPGGLAQWTWNPPQEQMTRVRIPPGIRCFLGKTWHFSCLGTIDFMCIVCVFKTEKWRQYPNIFFSKKFKTIDKNSRMATMSLILGRNYSIGLRWPVYFDFELETNNLERMSNDVDKNVGHRRRNSLVSLEWHVHDRV